MKNYASLIALIVLSVGWGCAARAQEKVQEPQGEPLITDRPDFTESPETVPVGRVQVESGVTAQREGGARQTTFGETLVRVAAGRRAEIRIGVPSFVRVRNDGRASGLDDAFLGAKFAISSRPGRHLGLIVGTTLPTGVRRAAARTFGPEAVLAAGFDLSPKTGLAINLGAGRPSEGNGRFSQFFGSASLGFELSNKLGAFAEVYAFDRTSPGGRGQSYADGGVTFGLSPDVRMRVWALVWATASAGRTFSMASG